MQYLSRSLLKSGNHAESKKFNRECVENIKPAPDNLKVKITYKIPKPVVYVDLAGGGFEPPTFGL